MGSLWNRSGIIERYADDLRAAGAKAYFYQGGTTSALTVFRDSGEAAAHANPVVADSVGRWPDVFVPYVVSYDVRVTTAEGVQLTFSQQIPNPDPVDLTVTIPAANQVQTGMIHGELINGTKSGYVRLNGRTIGSSASSATERANDDTQALFVYLYGALNDTIAPVSGGRTGNAAADFSPGNKTITLPNCQGASLRGLDDMGASAGGFFSGLTFGVGNSTTAGSRLGTNSLALVSGNMPAHSHSGTTATEGVHTHTGTTGNQSVDHTHTGTSSNDGAHQHDAFVRDPGHTHTLTGTPLYTTGGGNALGGTGGAAGNATTNSNTTGIHVNSVSGGGAGTDDKVASAGAHTHTMTTGIQSTNHTHSFTTGAGSAHSHTFTTDTQGSGTAFNNLGRTLLVTWYIKL